LPQSIKLPLLILSSQPQRKFSAKIFAEKPLPPRSGAAGLYFCKFRKRKYIFVKNENEKYKNKKMAPCAPLCLTAQLASAPRHKRAADTWGPWGRLFPFLQRRDSPAQAAAPLCFSRSTVARPAPWLAPRQAAETGRALLFGHPRAPSQAPAARRLCDVAT